jgi:hypothetical protein
MASEEVVKQPTGVVVPRPSFIETSTEGTEGITADDLKLPRLAIAQGLSPQMLPGDSAYIDGLKLFQLFNDLTGEIYGNGPIKFVIGRRDVKRIEFDPNDRKVPIDLDVPANDERNYWTKDENGRGVAPRATKFVEFIVLLLRDGHPPQPVVISISETNKFSRKASERLTGFTKMRQPPVPIYAGLYTVETKSEKNDKGTFGVFVFRNHADGLIQDEATYRLAQAFCRGLQGKDIHVQREAGDDSFDVDAMDASAGGM